MFEIGISTYPSKGWHWFTWHPVYDWKNIISSQMHNMHIIFVMYNIMLGTSSSRYSVVDYILTFWNAKALYTLCDTILEHDQDTL